MKTTLILAAFALAVTALPTTNANMGIAKRAEEGADEYGAKWAKREEAGADEYGAKVIRNLLFFLHYLKTRVSRGVLGNSIMVESSIFSKHKIFQLSFPSF